MSYNKGGTLARVQRGIERKEPVDHMVNFNKVQAVVVDKMSNNIIESMAMPLAACLLPRQHH